MNLQVASFGDRSKKDIALTFDDGPNPYFTLKVLKVLDSFNVKASFFVLGKRCLEYPELLKEIRQKGHLVGNHTFSHKKGDFKMCDDVITHTIGETSDYVRPPFYDLSFCNEESVYLKNKFVITGDVDPKDYLSIASNGIVRNTLENVKNGSVVNFHDGSEVNDDLKTRAQKTVDALPEIITALLRNRFNLTRVDAVDLQFVSFRNTPKS